MRVRRWLGVLALVVGGVIVAPVIMAQSTTTHTGDLFGDLVHIKRHPVTGQPILQKRMIEYPADVVDWGYCQIAVDAFGFELPFVDLSCEVDPAAATRLVPVDYFGRLSSGRTKESNLRMHFDEVISNIKLSEVVSVDASGRLVLGTGCVGDTCETWKPIDSPLENMGLYHRVMKYGHVQTDPLERDTSAHGDPEAGIVYHPALAAADFAKFRAPAQSLLASVSAADCYTGDTFIATCAAQQSLTAADFNMTSSFLGAASDKHGKTTMDLVHYMNRILRIPVATTATPATLNTLPALIRDESGVITPAPSGLPAPANERFMAFTPVSYVRNTGGLPTTRVYARDPVHPSLSTTPTVKI